jgi:DNA-directed RNA polymerase specialized sigma24 family protein
LQTSRYWISHFCGYLPSIVDKTDPSSLVSLNDALLALEKIDPRKCRVVELRFFAGLGIEETAEILKISANTVMRDWNMARAWLYRELSPKPDSGLDERCSGPEAG